VNVFPYFIASPTFTAPPLTVGLGVDDALDPDELAALMAAWQNPTYPEDSYLTEDQFNAEARTKSMQRAHSPAVLLCLLDEVDSINHPAHIHTFSECMNYRAQQDVSPKSPWTYWSEYDVFPFGPPQVIMPPTAAPHGWVPILRVDPQGISQMTGWSWSWTGFSFVVQVGSSQILTAGFGPGTQTRVTIAAAAIFSSLYVGPATTTPFKASQLFRLSFGGQNTNIQIDYTNADAQGNAYTRTSDPLPEGLDASNGLIVSGYITGRAGPYGSTSYLATPSQQLDWVTRYIIGDHAADLDKSQVANPTLHQQGWTVGGQSDLGLFWIEAFYP
jgi:hypothetical protein